MPDGFEQRLEHALSAREPRRVSLEGSRDAAVLIPIAAHPEPTLILTVRSEALPSHKGQISFPGGSIDPDDRSPAQAALREAYEEIMLDPARVRVLGELDSFPTFVSGYVVTPVVGWLEEAPELRPNPSEVAEILLVPVADLSEHIRREPGFSHAGRTYPTEAWVWRGHVVWGVTARILRHLLDVLAGAGLSDPPAATRSWTSWPVEPA